MSKKTDFDLLLQELGQSEKLLKASPKKTKDAEESEEEESEEEELLKAGAEGAEEEGEEDGATGATAGTEEEEEEEEEEESEEEESDDKLGKSFKLKDAKGKTIEAFDGMPLLKSLIKANKVLLQESVGTKKLLKALVANSTATGKALAEQRKANAELKKSIDNVANAGRGRRSQVTVIGGDDKGKGGMKPDEFMAKSLDAQRAGKISGQEVSLINASVNRGLMPSESLIRKVVAATAA